MRYVENIVFKGENAGCQHFLLFPQSFQKASFPGLLKKLDGQIVITLLHHHIADENFAVPHSRRGVIGMANKGRHTNGSQFYITLQPAHWMDTKYVAFG